MINEEEKKAIKILGTFEFRQKTMNYNKIDLEDIESTKIVLNLITKLQKENEEKAEQIDLMAEELRYDEELKFEVCKDCEPIKGELCGEPKKTQGEPTELECVKQYFEKLAKEKE